MMHNLRGEDLDPDLAMDANGHPILSRKRAMRLECLKIAAMAQPTDILSELVRYAEQIEEHILSIKE